MATKVKLRRHLNVRGFLDRAEAWLLRNETENNLLLGITQQLLRGNHSFQEPIYLVTAEIGGDVAGCAFRTPPYKLGLTRFPLAGIPLLVRDVHELYGSVPAVFGPIEEATGFAELWSRLCGDRNATGMRQGIYALESVIPPASYAAGALRRAETSDRALAGKWVESFVHDTGIPERDPPGRAEQLIDDGSLYLWQDDEPRSMAAAAGTTPNGVRIGYVYTPPRFRGCGYATAVVASASQRLLDDGHRYCFLFTDLANPTSNSVYQRIGYEKECDVIDINFTRSTEGVA